jgi:hypothetical protein
VNDYDYVVLKLVQTAERFPDRVAIVDEWCDVLGNQCMVGAAGGARPGSLTASSGVRIPVTEWSDERFRAILKAIPLSPSPIGTLIMGGVVSLSDKRMPWGQIVKELGLVPGEAPGEATPEKFDTVDAVDRGRINGGVCDLSVAPETGKPVNLKDEEAVNEKDSRAVCSAEPDPADVVCSHAQAELDYAPAG